MIAAIPYFRAPVFTPQIPGLEIDLPIDPWATLVCIGIVVGLEVARARAIKLGLDVRDIVDGAVVIVVTGFVVAHIVTVLFYKPERLAEEGIWAILKIWDGFSSMGGFLGAVLGAWIFYGFIRPVGAMRHTDLICFGFPFGWFFGRMGCGVVHDHIGRETNFFLAMEWPPGMPRHELGLYEMAYMVPVCALFWYWGRVDRVPGFFLGWFAVLYAPMRFGLDFLRATDLNPEQANIDPRYLGLTPAQYGMVVLFVAGAWLLWTRDHKGYVPVPMDGRGDAAPEPDDGVDAPEGAEAEVEP